MGWIVLTIFAILIGVGSFIYAGAAPTREGKFIGFGISACMFALWGVITLVICVHNVGQREVGIVHNFNGTISDRWVAPSTTFVAPWQHITTENVGLQNEKFNLDAGNSAVSSDQQAIFATISLNYQVGTQKKVIGKQVGKSVGDSIVDLYKRVGPNWKAILLDSRVLQDFKEVTSEFTAQQITTQREQLRVRTRERLATELAKYDITVVDFFVTNLHYSDAFQQAITDKNIQKQKALQAEAKVAQAQAEADQVVARAEGDAKSIALRGKALRDYPAVLQLEAIDKLNPNATVIFCTGTGSGNCPSFFSPNITGGDTGK